MDATRNRDAELALIGVSMSDRPSAVRLSALPDNCFSAPDTRAAHDAIRRMIADGQTPDLITVASSMRASVDNPEPMLADALQKGFGPSFYNQYEAIVLDCLKRRTAITAATKLLQGANDAGENIDTLLADAIGCVRNLGGSSNSVKLSDALSALLDGMENGWADRCQTGIANFDRLTGGVAKSNLLFIGARPGVGKTALALAMATHVAAHSGPVLFVSMEMTDQELAARICASASGIDMQKIGTGKLSDEEWGIFCPTMGELAKLPMWLDVKSRTPSHIRREAVKMQNDIGLSMVVVDYVQLLHTDKRSDSMYQEISEISRELKLMAMDLNIPIVVLTQFNRESEKTFGSTVERRKPKMSEARGSGSIEQDANIFITQWEPPQPTEPGTREWEDYCACEMNGWTWQVLEIEKNRQGPTGRISIAFDKAHMTFRCINHGRVACE